MTPIGVFVGAATLDLHHLVAPGRARDSKGPSLRFGMYAGGPAANAAVTFAHLGGRPVLFAEVGMHPLGDVIADELASRRVEVVDMTPDAESVPMVSSILSFEGTGDRMVVSSHYAHTGSASSLPRALPKDARVLLVDGFLRSPCLDAAQQADAAGVSVIFDGGSWKPGMDELLEFVDVAVCSADFRPPATEAHEEALDFLQVRGVQRVAITRGDAPILYRDGDESGQIPIEPVTAIDTLGAGDVLHGALCWYVSEGRAFPEALAEAAAVATRACQTFGTRSWMDL